MAAAEPGADGVPGSDASGPSVVPAGPRTARGERTRARLLEAARVAFADVGWSRARVEDVCRQAGVGHGTFYAYYANRTAVLEALVRRHAAALDDLVAQPWTGPDAREEVHRLIAGFVALSEADRDIRETWASAAPGEPALQALYGETRENFVRRIRAALAAAVEAGLARADLDVDVAGSALAAMVEQAVALHLAGELTGAPASERLVDGLTDLWVHAVYA